MLARWECGVCGTTLSALREPRLRALRARHEVACVVQACLDWQVAMRAQRRATALIDPQAGPSTATYLVDLRHKVGA